MSCPNPVRRRTLALALLALSASFPDARAATTNLTFANGTLTCEIVSAGDSIPGLVLSTLPVAMQAALEQVGAPPGPARLTVRLQEAPPFPRRALAWFRAEASALQQGDEILLRAGEDPLKLAFRLGHELAHWLTQRRHPARPPLWLDEGLAQRVGAAAAEACARTRKQTAERPRPPRLDRNLFTLDELVALRTYPRSESRSAAFYWQAEALAAALHRRLGDREFNAYLGAMASRDAPGWAIPLRERWYFTDWDFTWLAQQIQPGAAVHSEGNR